MITHTCPCKNPVIVDGPRPTGFVFGPDVCKLAYHWRCAELLGVPRPPTAAARIATALDQIVSASPCLTNAGAASARACPMCQTIIDLAREALGYAPLPNIPRTPATKATP